MGNRAQSFQGLGRFWRGDLKRFPPESTQSAWDILANFLVHCRATAFRSRAESFLNVVAFLRASWRRLPEKILGNIVQRSKMLANSWGLAWAIALGNAWRNRATSLGGSWAYWWCSSAAFFGKWCISPRGSWLIPVRFLGQCPGTSCNQLVGCWRPFAGKLGRLPWETSGQSCKGLWGVCPIPHAFLSDCFGESRKVLGGSWLVRGNSRKYWPSLCDFRPGRHRSSPNQASSQMVTI